MKWQPPKTGAAALDKDRPAHPADQETTTDSQMEMNKPTSPGSPQTGIQNPLYLEPPKKATASHNRSLETRTSYAGALMNQGVTDHVLHCDCNPTNLTKAITIPISMANTYHQVSETLLPHGPVEAISLDPLSQLHTVIFNCGCQAHKAKTNLNLVTEPFIPPPDFESEYDPRIFFKHQFKRKQPTELTPPMPSPQSFPKFFRLIPKDNPSTIDILAHLSQEIGFLQPNSITRVQNHFTLRVEKDSQSLMIMKIDLSNSKIIQQIYPHPELNSSKAVCYNKELYHTKKETIKSYASPQIKEVHQIKGTNNITIITFPTPQPPKKIEILGLTLSLEPYREKPKQCKKCFSYMHKTPDCRKEPRCSKCSSTSHSITNETCEKNPFCYLCRGNHPPTSRTCPVYISEEDLLNEALRRGCGRGHIRAEKRREATLNEEIEPRPSQPQNLEEVEEKREETPNQPTNWTEKQSRRKRRRENSNQTMTSVPEVPTFELPSIYRKELRKEFSDLSSKAEDRKKHKAHQNTNSQNITNINLPDNPNKSSPQEEETMETTFEDEKLSDNDVNLPLKPKPPKTTDFPGASLLKEKPMNITKSNPLSTQERKLETRTEALTVSSSLQSSTIEDLPTKNESPKRHPSEKCDHEQHKLFTNSSPTASSQEPPKKRGKQGSPNPQSTDSPVKTSTPTTKTGSRKSKRCSICKTSYKTLTCFKEHQAYFHPHPNSKPNAEKIPNCDASRVPRDHKCSEVPHERCLTLYKIYRDFPSEENTHLVDSRESIYESVSHFRRGIKRTSTALKQNIKEKIYGPQATSINTNPDDNENTEKKKQIIISKNTEISKDPSQTKTTNFEQIHISEAQRLSSEVSQRKESQISEKSSPTRNIVKNVVAQLEVAGKKHLQHHPLQSTWPSQLGHSKEKTQFFPSTRDPRLRSYSDLYKLGSKNIQTIGPYMKSYQHTVNQQSKVESESQQLHRALSLNSLHESTSHPIQTLISTRKEKPIDVSLHLHHK